MQTVLILGACKIGALISGFLADSRDYDVHVADVNGNAANAVVAAHGLPNLCAHEFDAADPTALEAHLRVHPADAIISSLPFYCNVKVAEVARKVNAHYFDLTEDVAVTRAVRALAEGSSRAFVPQCGLAPGFISIAANALIRHFDEVRSVKLRVGALPQHPNNALKYSPDDASIIVALLAMPGWVRISVTDGGPGMSAGDAAGVFQKYQRSTTAFDSEGAGLGLFISKKIVEAHGGTIGVRSTCGVGSQFYVELPRA